MFAQAINTICLSLAQYSTAYLFPLMVGLFLVAITAKFLVYYIVKSQHSFTEELEKRIYRHIDSEYEETSDVKGYDKVLGILLEKTIQECFRLRVKNMRRKLDFVQSLTDRLFLIEDGAMRLSSDLQREARYYDEKSSPNFEGTSYFALSINPYFNKLFGLIPTKSIQSICSILPGLFIIGGIFGTFLGIASGIPGLKNMDPTNAELAKVTLGTFLDSMAFSLNTSVVGIFLSVCMSVLNNIFSTKTLQFESVHKLLHSLEILWREDCKRGSERSSSSSTKINLVDPNAVTALVRPVGIRLVKDQEEDLPPIPADEDAA